MKKHIVDYIILALFLLATGIVWAYTAYLIWWYERKDKDLDLEWFKLEEEANGS